MSRKETYRFIFQNCADHSAKPNPSALLETSQGSGYRFVAGVESVNGDTWQKSLPNAPVTKFGYSNSESYKFYLKGKYFLQKNSIEGAYKAIECFQKSFSHDPVNLLSYVGTVESYLLLHTTDHISFAEVSDKITPFLSIISKLDQDVDVVQAMYGGIKMYLEWKFEESEKPINYALMLNPNCIVARYRYTDILALSGRFSEALKQLQKRILLIDSLSALTYKRIGRMFYKMGQYECAVFYLKDALELEPTDYGSLLLLGASLAELGNYNEALAVLEKSLNLYFSVETLSMIGYLNAIEGRKQNANQVIQQIKAHSKGYRINAISLARIYAALGEIKTAFEFLEMAFEQHDVDLISITADPRWASIKNEPKFRELVRRVGLPAMS